MRRIALLLAVASGLVPGAATAAPTEGRLVVLHADDFDRGRSEHTYAIDEPGGRRVPVTLAPGAAAPEPGSRVRATTGVLDAVLEAPAAEPQLTTRRVAAVMFNFSNDTRQPASAETVRRVLWSHASSVAGYYREVSYGAMNLTGRDRADGDVYGWVTIQATNANCAGNIQTWTTQARAAVTAAGGVLAGYDNIVWVFPSLSSCGWGGLGEVNGANSWVNGIFTPRVYAHELGHNFGVHHASAWTCRDETGARVPVSTDCDLAEYGDPFDVMGSGGGVNVPGFGSIPLHLNNFFRHQIGWLPDASAVAPGPGTYRIAPAEQASGLRGLRIALPDASSYPGRSYYLEYRRPSEFDTFAVTDPVANGVTIRSAPALSSRTQTWLVDTNPGTATFSDAPLADGRSFSDPEIGLTVTQVSHDAASAEVRIDVAPSIPGALDGVASPDLVRLAWQPSSVIGGGTVTGYHVERDGVEIATPLGARFNDRAVEPGRTYTYRVIASSPDGSLSAPATLEIATPVAGDSTPPSPPAIVRTIARTTTTILMSWSGATDDVAVAGYGVYRDGELVAYRRSSEFRDSGLRPGTVYRYRIVAFDTGGNASVPSDELITWTATTCSLPVISGCV